MSFGFGSSVMKTVAVGRMSSCQAVVAWIVLCGLVEIGIEIWNRTGIGN